MSDFRTFDAITHPIVKLADDWNNLLDHGLVKTASYIIRKNGTVYEAIDGNTGKILTSNADAATVIQAAQNALTSGGEIHFKSGVFSIGIPITITHSGITLSGEGASSILFLTANTDMFAIGDAPNLVQKITIKELKLDGDRDNRASGNGIGLVYVSRFIIDKCWLENFPEAAIKASVFNTGNSGMYEITNNYFLNNFRAIDGAELRDGIILGNNIGNQGGYASDTYAISLKSGSHQIYSNHFWSLKTNIYLRMPINVDISHNWFEGGQTGCCIDTWTGDGEVSYNYVISGNQFYDGGGIDFAISIDCHAGGLYVGLNINNNIMYAPITNALTFGVAGTYNSTIITDNIFSGILTNVVNKNIYDNIGFITENNGTTHVDNGAWIVDISHGLDYTPMVDEISIITTNDSASRLTWFIDPAAITSIKFSISITVTAPWLGDANFAWFIHKSHS